MDVQKRPIMQWIAAYNRKQTEQNVSYFHVERTDLDRAQFTESITS